MLDKPIKRKPVILCIMDGFGMRKENYGNAINQAKKPHLDDFFASFPFTEIDASGLAVGLPEGQMGNSEVGHMNMGAGRVVYQSYLSLARYAVRRLMGRSCRSYRTARRNVHRLGPFLSEVVF